MSHLKVGAAVTAGALGLGLLGAAPASAATSDQVLNCDGTMLTVRVPDQNSNEHGGFSAGQLLFSGTQAKSNGNANQNQTSITCSQTMTGPGEQPPPSVSPTEEVTTTLTVTAVPRP